MAVTINQVAANLRLQADPSAAVDPAHVAVLTPLLAWAQSEVLHRAPNAPAQHADLAVIALCAWAYDRPSISSGATYANAWQSSMAAQILRPWTVRRAVAITGTTEVGADGSPGSGAAAVDRAEVESIIREIVLPADAYEYHVVPTINETAPVAGTDIMASEANGYTYDIVPEWDGPAGVVADNDFVTEWTGFMVCEMQTACNLEVTLRTLHEFNDKSLVHERVLYRDFPAGIRETIPLNVFNSRSQVRVGTYGGVEVTAEDIASAVKITYQLRFRSYARKSDTQRNNNILVAVSLFSPKTVSYQLRRAIQTGGGGGGTVVPGGGGGTSVAQVQNLIQGLVATWALAASGDAQIPASKLENAVDQEARNLANAAQGTADDAKEAADGFDASIESNEDWLERLAAVTEDLRAGETSSGWAEVSDDQVGGIGLVSGEPAIGKVGAITSWAAKLDSGLLNATPVVRIRLQANQALYRLAITSTSDNTIYVPLNSYVVLGQDQNWRYFSEFVDPLGSGVASIALQATGTEDHVGSSSFLGDLKGTWQGKTQADISNGAEVAAAESQIEALQRLTQDLHSGPAATGWRNLADGSEGGINVLATRPDLTKAKAVATWGTSQSSLVVTLAEQYPVVRIPADDDARDFRVQIGGLSDGSLETYNEPLNHWPRLGLSDDEKWQFYGDDGFPLGVDVRLIRLQITGDSSHKGTSTFRGNLEGFKVNGAVVRLGRYLPPAPPAAGSRDGKFLGYKDDAIGWRVPPGGGGGVGTAAVTADIGTKTIAEASPVNHSNFMDLGITVDLSKWSYLIVHFESVALKSYNQDGTLRRAATYDDLESALINTASLASLTVRTAGSAFKVVKTNPDGLAQYGVQFRPSFVNASVAMAAGNKLLLAVTGSTTSRYSFKFVVRGMVK